MPVWPVGAKLVELTSLPGQRPPRAASKWAGTGVRWSRTRSNGLARTGYSQTRARTFAAEMLHFKSFVSVLLALPLLACNRVTQEGDSDDTSAEAGAPSNVIEATSGAGGTSTEPVGAGGARGGVPASNRAGSGGTAPGAANGGTAGSASGGTTSFAPNGGTAGSASSGAPSKGGASGTANAPCRLFHDPWEYRVATYYEPGEEPIVTSVYGGAEFYPDRTYEQNYRIGGISNIYSGTYTIAGDRLKTYSEEGKLVFDYSFSCDDQLRTLVLTLENDDGTPSIVYGLESLTK